MRGTLKRAACLARPQAYQGGRSDVQMHSYDQPRAAAPWGGVKRHMSLGTRSGFLENPNSTDRAGPQQFQEGGVKR